MIKRIKRLFLLLFMFWWNSLSFLANNNKLLFILLRICSVFFISFYGDQVVAILFITIVSIITDFNFCLDLFTSSNFFINSFRIVLRTPIMIHAIIIFVLGLKIFFWKTMSRYLYCSSFSLNFTLICWDNSIHYMAAFLFVY